MNSSTLTFDVIILGGGIIGLTMVNLLASQGFRVGLLEKEEPNFSRTDLDLDIRFSAISPGSIKILESIGVWETINKNASDYEKMIVWDAQGFGEISFDAGEVNASFLGCVVQNQAIIKALWEKAKTRPEVYFILGKNIETLEIKTEDVMIATDDSQRLRAKCLIGADGAHSWLRQYLNFKVSIFDYQQHAVVATVQTELPHNKTAWQRFLPRGPLAFLPLKFRDQSSLVWSTTPAEAIELQRLSDFDFCRVLSQQFDYRLGRVLKTTKRCVFPLKKIEVDHIVRSRVGLIGDAAHVVHPLAGQGVNLGFRDAKILTTVLTRSNSMGIDIGNISVLRQYERACKGKVLGVTMALDFLKRLFSAQSSLVIGLRSIGLNRVEQSNRLKKRIMQYAMEI